MSSTKSTSLEHSYRTTTSTRQSVSPAHGYALRCFSTLGNQLCLWRCCPFAKAPRRRRHHASSRQRTTDYDYCWVMVLLCLVLYLVLASNRADTGHEVLATSVARVQLTTAHFERMLVALYSCTLVNGTAGYWLLMVHDRQTR